MNPTGVPGWWIRDDSETIAAALRPTFTEGYTPVSALLFEAPEKTTALILMEADSWYVFARDGACTYAMGAALLEEKDVVLFRPAIEHTIWEVSLVDEISRRAVQQRFGEAAAEMVEVEPLLLVSVERDAAAHIANIAYGEALWQTVSRRKRNEVERAIGRLVGLIGAKRYAEKNPAKFLSLVADEIIRLRKARS